MSTRRDSTNPRTRPRSVSTEQTGAQEHQFLELVRAREQAALAALAHATGDSSLCALARAGTPHPAAKFHEGAVSALADVRRTLTRQRASSSTGAVAGARAHWEDYATLAERGRDWAAYYAGGVEALDLLAEAAAASSCADSDNMARHPRDQSVGLAPTEPPGVSD